MIITVITSFNYSINNDETDRNDFNEKQSCRVNHHDISPLIISVLNGSDNELPVCVLLVCRRLWLLVLFIGFSRAYAILARFSSMERLASVPVKSGVHSTRSPPLRFLQRPAAPSFSR